MASTLTRDSDRVQGITADRDDLTLRGRRFHVEVSDQVVGDGIEINRSIEGASTLKIPLLDDDGELRRHPLFQSLFTLEVDGLEFVYVGREKAPGGVFSVMLEAKNVWRLRQHTGPERAYRDKVTRAEFWVGLVRRLRPSIPVFCPELHVEQQIAGTRPRSSQETKRYPFTIAANETWWDGGTRLFEEVNWRLFESAGEINIVAEPELLASPIRMRVSEGAPGIDVITWNVDEGVLTDELTVRGRAADWAAPPGTVAAVEGEGESVDGNYLVANIRSWLGHEDVEITLKRPTKPFPEPAPQTAVERVGGGRGRGEPSPSAGLAGISVTPTLGAPHWGGAADVMHQLVDPIMAQHGLEPGGTKETGHTAGGDHDPAVTNAYATDYSTSTGEAAARDVARVLGDESVVHTYDAIYFTADSVRFRAQVLWDLTNPTPGPGDYAHRGHVHVGIRRV